MKRKVRLKKKIFLWLLLIVVVILIAVFLSTSNHKEKNSPKIDYVNSILEKDDTFDREFLSWVDKNYKEALEKVDLVLQKNNYDITLWHELTGNTYQVLWDLYQDRYKDRRDVTLIEGKREEVTVSFAGDVSLADNWFIMPKYWEREKKIQGVLSDGILKYMKDSDWMTVNSEFAFSDRGSPLPNKLYTFRGSPSNVSLYREMGVDMVTLANNHVYDYGKDAFLDTLTTFQNDNLPYIGAGINLEEAARSYYLIINGYKISFLNATRAEKYIMTPEATEEKEGVFRCYDTTKLVERIKEEKAKSDYVVLIVHWGTEDTHLLQDVQKETGKLYIDSGADLVVGHHAHVLQGVEFYQGKLIAYNLGNFLFNDLSVETGILTWKLDWKGKSQFSFLPALQEDCFTKEVTGKSKEDLLQKMTDWSINATFLENGHIVERQ